MADLKPCPFCGGEASIVSTEPRLYRPSRNGKYAVACYGCEIYLGYDEDYGCQFDTEEEAIEAWNTRKPIEAVVAELEIEKERHEKDRTYWSEHSWKDSLMYNECDMSDRKADCFDKAISIVRGKE